VTAIRSCLACGAESHDVAMVLIDHDDKQRPDYLPLAEQRVVEVPIVSAEDQRGVKGFEYAQVRERYISEPRCRDKAACQGRVKALQPIEAPSADRAEEGPSWLL
jgi:hypothetical protein